MSRSFSVVVLYPSRRRETVKVTQNTSLLQVLEEACLKKKINPENHELRHHNKPLDLSLPIRFSNLQNNALLELHPAANSRKDCLVTVALQLESGERFTKDFPPSTCVHDIIEECLKSNSIEMQKVGEPICIYMRQKIVGDAIKSTTLRSLGLTNGQAIIRLLFRKPGELEDQAHVSSPLVPAAPTNSNKEPEWECRNSATPTNSNEKPDWDALISAVPTNSNKKPEWVSPVAVIPVKPTEQVHYDSKLEEVIAIQVVPKVDIKRMEENNSVVNIDYNENSTVESRGSSERVRLRDYHNSFYSKEKANENVKEPLDQNESMDYESQMQDTFTEIGEIKYIGDRHSVIYSLDDITNDKKADLPDEFFELTIKDATYLMQEYIRERKELENQPLLTKQQREQQFLRKLANYSQTVIRIYFPERLVLQAVFSAVETVQTVCDFIQSFLEDKSLNFHLYITPPKEKLSLTKTLLECMLVPAAVVYFGCDTILPGYLLGNLRDSLSDPRAAALAASTSRKTIVSNVNLDPPCQSTSATVVGEKVAGATSVAAFRSSLNTTDQEKVPKWLKLSKK